MPLLSGVTMTAAVVVSAVISSRASSLKIAPREEVASRRTVSCTPSSVPAGTLTRSR